MASKVLVTQTCDLDHPEGEAESTTTRRFSLDGRDFEIDLCDTHNEKADEAFGPYAENARVATLNHRPPVNGRPARVVPRSNAQREYTAAVRDWAKQQGVHVADRGRIPADVVAKYDAVH